jgi:hypothetical protein
MHDMWDENKGTRRDYNVEENGEGRMVGGLLIEVAI